MVKYYTDITWKEFVKYRDEGYTFALVVGAIEQHGQHMPLGVDYHIPYELTKKIAEKYDLVIMPPLAYGYRSQTTVGGGDKYPGTIRMSSEAMIYPIRDIVMELFRHQVKRILIINGHLENEGFIVEGIEKAIAEYKGKINTKVIFAKWHVYIKDETLDTIFQGTFPGWDPEHAAVCETSVMLTLKPELVQMDNLPDEKPAKYVKYSVWPAPDYLVTPNGALADASKSSIENGELMMKDVMEGLYLELDEELTS